MIISAEATSSLSCSSVVAPIIFEWTKSLSLTQARASCVTEIHIFFAIFSIFSTNFKLRALRFCGCRAFPQRAYRDPSGIFPSLYFPERTPQASGE